MENKSRFLMARHSPARHPIVTLTGAWFRNAGFCEGGRVIVTPTEPGTLLVIADPSGTIMHDLKDARHLAISESPLYQPRVVLQGVWFRKFGFEIGDQVSVTCIEPGTLLVKVETSPRVIYTQGGERKLKAQLEAAKEELAAAAEELEQYRAGRQSQKIA